MKLNLTIKYTNGEQETYTAGLPEWAKWERKTGKSIYKMTDIREYQQTDFLFLAHAAYVRAAAVYRSFINSMKEDAPVNAVGGGQIAGLGVGPQGEPQRI